MPEVEIICLANSRKLTGRCVAGLRTDGMGWVRPVSALPDGTLYTRDYTLDHGNKVELLDIVRIYLKAPRPDPYQPENWVLANRPWHLVRRLAPADTATLFTPAIVPGPDLLGNQSDRIASAVLERKPAEASLALVEPEKVKWRITRSIRGKRQTRASFVLAGIHYDLPVTDPKWEEGLASLPLGLHTRDITGVKRKERILFTISLGEPFDGDCYKLIAAVIVLPVEKRGHP